MISYSIYVTNAPPEAKYTHPNEKLECVYFFFLNALEQKAE